MRKLGRILAAAFVWLFALGMIALALGPDALALSLMLLGALAVFDNIASFGRG